MLMAVGRPYGQLHSLPPKRADSFMAQVIETTMDLSQEFVGAVAPSDLFINYSYYSNLEYKALCQIANDFQDAIADIKETNGSWCTLRLYEAFIGMLATTKGVAMWNEEKQNEFYNLARLVWSEDKDLMEVVKVLHLRSALNDFQKFVHVVNNKFRTSGQSPFVNISLFDMENLEQVFGETVFPDGSKPDFEYIMVLQKLFGEWFSEGDPASNLPYRFPVATINLLIDREDASIKDEDFLLWTAQVNIKKGSFNIYINDGNKIATCCRLSNDFSQMQYRADSFGNGGLNLGSHRVVSVNLPRIALEAYTTCPHDMQARVEAFFTILEHRMEQAKDLLMVHREEILRRRIKKGFLKFFFPLQWFDMQMLFSTFGKTGDYETCFFMGLPMETEEGQAFTERMLRFLENKAQEYSKQYGYAFNVEEIPGESVAPTFAYMDSLLFGKELQPFELYSNQYVPLIADVDAVDRVTITGRFMKFMSGGGIFHFNVANKMDKPESMVELIRWCVKAGIQHLGVNFGFGICEKGHSHIVGNGKICPQCGSSIKDWMTRIIGYFTKTSSWNDVRKNYEFMRRKFY